MSKSSKSGRDNRTNQLNPNNAAYAASPGESKASSNVLQPPVADQARVI